MADSELKRRYKLMEGAHFFDVKIKEGKREITVSGTDQRVVMDCLFKHLGADRECWPSQLRLSIACSFTSPEQLERYRATGKLPSLNKIKRTIKALEDNGYILIERRKLGGEDRKTQNVYQFVWSNIEGINNHQSEFFFAKYQSPTEQNQSPTRTDQSPTEQYQSPTCGTLTTNTNNQLEDPIKTTNAIGQENKFSESVDGWQEPEAVDLDIRLVFKVSELIRNSFDLSRKPELELCSRLAESFALGVWDVDLLELAIKETLKPRSKRVDGKPPPEGGFAKLNYFQSIVLREMEERVCR